MNRKLKHKAKYEEHGKLLTLSQCRQQMFISLFFAAFIVIIFGASLATHQHRSRYALLMVCLWGLVWAISFLQSWKQYRLIRQGVAVYVTSPKPLPLPKLVSVPVTAVLSVIVFVIDAMAIFIAGVRVHTLEAWAIAAVIILPLTLYIAYCWHRIVGENRRPQAAAAELASRPETRMSDVTAYHKKGNSKFVRGGFTHGDYIELGPRRRNSDTTKGKRKGTNG